MMGDEEGPMHDAMISAFADALGLTPEELEDRHDEGESLWQIAEDLGLSESEIQALMVSARGEAMAQAVADGQLTQEGADEMLSHMGAGTFDSGSCDGSAGGFHGHGMKEHGINWDYQHR
jgi:DNA-binding phage protein